VREVPTLSISTAPTFRRGSSDPHGFDNDGDGGACEQQLSSPNLSSTTQFSTQAVESSDVAESVGQRPRTNGVAKYLSVLWDEPIRLRPDLGDVDFVDPAFAPGTGTPEVGGPSSEQALAYVRALTGIDFRGFDCVEVSPPYDPSGITAWLPRACASRCCRSGRYRSPVRGDAEGRTPCS
jgi:Arginase family